ncbi:hypothetical protein EIP91_000970 [Steccherinum ochraceum]|uniref:Uncharacterized protein n=1 Tax=Steccherinum ochraceum TaxID=92696 RepID=A0A4R0RNF3_9APHY|nr:hypothetical protein EIP91_000970 [Steccherinum ochraceum]
MPPRPKPTPRKPSVSTKDAPKVQSSMPPPPDPPQPQGILVPEAMALSACLRNAVVNTGQIYAHYADTRKLAIHKHAPYPPRSLTASLGREVEKYDQLCDAIESHLLHAINVLQRDLSRAQDKLKAATAVPMAVTPVTAQPPLPPSDSPTQATSMDDALQTDTKVPSSLRRASTISLSSLQRPPFPHKLDLSAAALRINPEDLQSGLTSPVALAPKSSISRHPPDLLGGQHVDIDLTLDDEDIIMGTSQMGADAVPHGLGNSADKPIELDLDLEMDLFGGGPQQHAQGTSAPQVSPVIVPKQEDSAMDLSLLTGGDATGGMSQDSLMGFNPTGLPSNSVSTEQLLTGTLGVPPQGQPSAVSPGSLIPGLQQNNGANGEAAFDFDLNFLEPTMDMRMDDLFDMNSSVQPQGGDNSGTTGN